MFDAPRRTSTEHPQRDYSNCFRKSPTSKSREMPKNYPMRDQIIRSTRHLPQRILEGLKRLKPHTPTNQKYVLLDLHRRRRQKATMDFNHFVRS